MSDHWVCLLYHTSIHLTESASVHFKAQLLNNCLISRCDRPPSKKTKKKTRKNINISTGIRDGSYLKRAKGFWLQRRGLLMNLWEWPPEGQNTVSGDWCAATGPPGCWGKIAGNLWLVLRFLTPKQEEQEPFFCRVKHGWFTRQLFSSTETKRYGGATSGFWPWFS